MLNISNIKLFLISILFSLSIGTLSANDTSNKYYYAKKNYASALLHNNKAKEKIYLKQVILYGSKLKKNVNKYKNELSRLNSSSTFFAPQKSTKFKYSTVKQKKVIKKPSKTLSKKLNIVKKSTSNKYSITSVETVDNTIEINFNHNISKKHIKFSEVRSKGRYTDVFDIVGNFKDAGPTKLEINGVRKIKIVQYRYKTLRISVMNSFNTKTIYIIKKNKIIIKMLDLKKTTKKKTSKTKAKMIRFNKTVVIDAGHGGKDSGAVGVNKVYEKRIVLSIAKRLYKKLKQKGFNVYLTRSSDKYISLRYRTKYANKKDADIFISIHANAVEKRKAKKIQGIETYYLSPARSARAKRVAAKENKEDMNTVSYSDTKGVLLSILNSKKIDSSHKMAIDIQAHMLHKLHKSYKDVIDGGVKKGPFWVLVGAQMPSVLIEVGYISHPKEGRRVASTKYQQRVADGIANGVMSYFKKNN